MALAEAEGLQSFKELVAGSCEDVPKQESNTVRVFISSTFTDMIHERNKLTREVYPRLQRYCQERGLDFEAVDMRWGVHDNVTTDHKTTELCMLEIDQCKKLSQGPCFVAFLGNKYGYRPLCATIDAEMFDTFCGLLDTEAESSQMALLKGWYRRDENAVPPVYLLQPITNQLPHFDDSNLPELQASAKEEWWRVSLDMRTLFASAAQKAVESGTYPYESVKHFFSSVTEQEVLQAFEGNEDPEGSIAVFMRELDGLYGSASSPRKRIFIDCDKNGEVDEDAQSLLRTLKEDFIPSKLPSSSIYEYSVPWTQNGLDPDCPEQAAYLSRFTQQFYDSVLSLIDRKLGQRSQVGSPELKALYEELIHHYSFQREKCRFFRGREEVMIAIHNALNVRPDRPCVLHGISGSGKTSVMAMYARQAVIADSSPEGLVCVLRFLGTSPLSSSIRDTILSVCQQICYAYDLDQPRVEETEDFHKLDMFFKALLIRAPTERKPLLLLLDSIDQLSPTNNVFSMNWLPLTFSRHAQVIVSMLPEVNGCLDNMRQHLDDPGCYAGMTPMEQDLGLEIMDNWLSQQGRQISEEQRRIVSTAIDNCPQPLFLKILFEEVSEWTSYRAMMDDFTLPPTVREAIRGLFEKLERNHGDLLLTHTLGYLIAGRQGITEVELQDILSCDDEVLNEIYQYWDPPQDTVVRIPTSVWKRLRFDIQEFLTERQAGGKTVLGWYHRQFIEAARDRYMRDPTTVQKRNALLSDMFLDVYREGKTNPIQLGMRGRSFPMADRQVAPQPLEFEGGMYNLRKLQELPFYLSCAKDFTRLKENVVYNFDWLFAKLSSCSFNELIADVGLVRSQDSEIGMLKDSLLMSRSCIQSDPRALAGQLIARIGDQRDISPLMVDLLEQCERWTAATSSPLFVPRSVFLKPPGGPLVTTFGGHPSRVVKVAASQSHQVMVSACEDDHGHPVAFLWDLKTYDLILDVHVPNRRDRLGLGHIVLEIDHRGDSFVFGSQDLQLFRMSNGNKICDLLCHSEDESTAFSQVQYIGDDRMVGHRKNSLSVLVWSSVDGTLAANLLHTDQVIHTCPVGPSLLVTASGNGVLHWWSLVDPSSCVHSVIVFDGEENITAMARSTNGDMILVSGDKYSLQSWASAGSPTAPIHSFPAHSRPVSHMFPFEDEMVAVGYLDGTLKFWNLSTWECEGSAKPHKKEITCFASTGDLVVVGSLDDTLSVWCKGDASLINTLEGHSSWIADVAATVGEGTGDVTIISASNDRNVILWNPDLKLENNRERHTKKPYCIAMSEDGSSVFSGSSDGTVKHWDFASGHCLHTWRPGVTTTCLALIGGDQWLVGGMADGRVTLWDVVTLAETKGDECHGGEVTFLCGCPEPLQFVSGSKDRSVKLWERGRCLVTLEGHTDNVVDAAMTSDSRTILVSGATNGEVRFWDPSGRCLSSAMHCPGLERVIISHSNQYAVTGSRGETLVVWSLQPRSIGSRLRAMLLTSDSVKGLAFTHDDRFIISGTHTAKNQLHKWDFLGLENDSMYLEGHNHAIMCLHVTGNDKYLITGSRDCALKAWDLTSGRVLASFHCACQVKHFAVAEVSDGHYRVAAANKTGEMALYDVYLDDNVTRAPHLRRQSKAYATGEISQLHDGPPKLRRQYMKKTKICGLV